MLIAPSILPSMPPVVDRRLHFYTKGEFIPLLDDTICQVYTGIIQLSAIYPDGDEGVLGWVGSGMCFGGWVHNDQTNQAIALSDVCLVKLSLIEVHNSVQLAQEILPQLMRRSRQMEALLGIKGQRRVEERLQQLLILLKQEFGQPIEGGIKLNIRLTHQDIGNAICTTRVTVTRIFSKWQQQGLLGRDLDRFLILKNDFFNC